MKNKAVMISASRALDAFLAERVRKEPDFDPYYRAVLLRAVYNVEKLVNLRRLDADENFDSVQFAINELGYFFGVRRTVFDEVVLGED